MLVLDELKAMQEEVTMLEEDITRKEKSVEELKATKKALLSKIDLAVRVSQSHTEDAKEKSSDDSAALAKLYEEVQAQSGDMFDAAFRAFADKAALDLPADLIAAPEEEPETELAKAV